MTTPLDRLDWRRPAPAVAEPPLWRDPPRLLLLLAAVGMIGGSVMPWATGTGPAGRLESYRATQGTGEGVLLIAGALVLAYLARDRALWESASRTVQLLPLLVALVGASMWIGAEHFARLSIDEWVRNGYSGDYTAARYVVAGAVVLVLVAFIWFELNRPADVRRRTRALWVEWGITAWSLGKIAAAIVLGGIGAALGLAVGLLVLGAELIIIAVILAVFGLFGGIGLAVILTGRVESAARPR
ncbi:MAG: hypothetical protein M3N29_09550 [Chloroflexota bacterium]|nr:hypothetical protein [Chloroflexota bacterium]